MKAMQLHSIIGSVSGRVDIITLEGAEAIAVAEECGFGLYVAAGRSRADIMTPTAARRAMAQGHHVKLPVACTPSYLK